jgi:hypothetical protein
MHVALRVYVDAGNVLMFKALLLSTLVLFPSYASEPVAAKLPASKMDCLAKVCLLSPLSKSSKSSVQVSSTAWEINVTQCKGKVVTVFLSKPYLQEATTAFSAGVVEVAPTYELSKVSAAAMILQLTEQMSELGWQAGDPFATEDGFLLVIPFTNNKITGARKIVQVKKDNMIILALTSEHPDADAMCAGSLKEGL